MKLVVKDYLFEKIEHVFEKLGFDKNDAGVSYSGRPEVCDFQCNSAFGLAKKLGKNPMELANMIAKELEVLSDEFEISVLPPAFINFKMTDKFLSKIANLALDNQKNLIKTPEKPIKVVLDYGGANVAKELHVGHLRSPIIGEALCRLNRLMGNTAISDVHLGDWGLQMGLTIAQLEDDGYLDGYFGKGKNKEITLDTLNEEYPKASKRKKEDDAFHKKAEDYTLKVQRKIEPYYSIYQDIRELSVKRIAANYETLGCHFDLWYGESTADPYVEKAIQIFKDKNIARISDGALVVDVAVEGENIPIEKKTPDEPQRYKNPMPPAILKKHNDADGYATTDIATILMRNEHDAPDKIVYVVDFRQSMHFIQVFRASKLAGISPKEQELVHVSYGTMNGKDGKAFKTRSGETIKLEDIINLITSKAEEKLKANGIEGNKKLALQIGVGAMKYGDLSNIASKDYVFDIDRFSSFEGKTGPYIQYTAARINSLLEKAGTSGGEIVIDSPETRNIIVNLIKLLDSYYVCYQENSLNALCLAVYNLASSFSLFYNNIRVLTEKDEKKKKSYLSLCALVKDAIVLALDTLGIETPNRM
ncbi:MAG: arginine--tRNA ligase [Clostridia bacterium]|nr:arginine--tRNA ligase [Clostridia bacterium]